MEALGVIARFGSDKADPPGLLYLGGQDLGGQVLWTRDEKSKK